MSTFSETAVETLDEWNAILANGCCCEMPTCPVPTQECESMDLSLSMCAVIGSNHYGQSAPTGASSTYYLKQTTTRVIDHDGDFIGPPAQHWEQTQETVYFYDAEYPVEMSFSGSCDSDYSSNASGSSYCPYAGSGTVSFSVTGSAASGYSIQRTETIGAKPGDTTHSYSDVETVTYSEPVSDQFAYLIGNAEARYAYLGFTANGSNCISLLSITATDADTEATAIDWQKARFKWVIPNDFEGTYFKVTWDVVFFPNTGDPSAVSTDNTWEWTGPGDPEDADSWKSGWYEIPVPAEPGESRVVNMRFECYRSAAFGTRPQIAGEAVEIPPP